MSKEDFFHIEPNPHVLAESSFDNGYSKSKQDILNIIDNHLRGPYEDKARDILYNIRREIEKL